MNNLKIEERKLGKSGIIVRCIGMGLWGIGGDMWGKTDDKESLEAIEKALELGINFFDTADVYGDGHSEELLGRAMKGRRDKFIVATKIGWKNFDGDRKISAYNTVDKLIRGVEENLKRLNTDYIDIIQNHINFREPNMEIFIEGFQKLKRDGKVRAYGVSTSDFEYLKEFNKDGGCATLQIDYSILNRTAEKEIFPYCIENNIGVIVRGALAMGILTGKFTKDTQFSEGDFRQNWQKNPDEREIFYRDLETVEKLRPLAKNKTLSEIAIQFVLAHPAVSVVIPGAKNVRQVEMNFSAGTLSPLTKEELRIIDSIVPPGGGRKIWPA
ncbi:MAG: aldo/keto reductase [Brevinematales bacterium]|nr:aldo/keto reductase [Brevinematales bacterium]